ncbi:Uncharacterised protein [Mycoplasmopsis caviae]|uniref:Uncharacterized protein n=1 Tax=Mycoplasmopsis caviae TaxID=55603 RepID=A0A3P8KM06_9BACT|nr:Uncharacterised protein [Mycoplasmopsis caviae]
MKNKNRSDKFNYFSDAGSDKEKEKVSEKKYDTELK